MPQPRSRSFSTEGTNDGPPLTFDIDGEVFTCKPMVPAGVVLDLISDTATKEEIYGLFKAAMEPDEYLRFAAFIHSEDRIVSFDVLGDIAAYLTEEYSGRPTVRPASSPGGP